MGPGSRVYRLSVEDVHKMVAAGVLDEDDRLELVQGVLVEMNPIGPEHDGAVAWLTGHFARAASSVWEVRVQSTLLVAGVYDEVVTYADGESVQPALGDVPAVAVSELLG